MNVKKPDELQTAQNSYRYPHLNVRLWPHSVICVFGILKSYSYDIQGQFL